LGRFRPSRGTSGLVLGHPNYLPEPIQGSAPIVNPWNAYSGANNNSLCEHLGSRVDWSQQLGRFRPSRGTSGLVLDHPNYLPEPIQGSAPIDNPWNAYSGVNNNSLSQHFGCTVQFGRCRPAFSSNQQSGSLVIGHQTKLEGPFQGSTPIVNPLIAYSGVNNNSLSQHFGCTVQFGRCRPAFSSNQQSGIQVFGQPTKL
jgi:hypothetical protein